jgi:hypothetical protein
MADIFGAPAGGALRGSATAAALLQVQREHHSAFRNVPMQDCFETNSWIVSCFAVALT